MRPFLNDSDVIPTTIDFADLDGEVEQMLAGFDRCRKRVTGRHFVAPATTPPSGVWPEAVPFPMRLARSEVTPAVLPPPDPPAGRSSRRASVSRFRLAPLPAMGPASGVKPAEGGPVVPLPPFPFADSPAKTPDGGNVSPAGRVSPGDAIPASLPPLPPPPPPLPDVLPPVTEAPPSIPDKPPRPSSLLIVSALPEAHLNEWLSETEEAIASRDLGTMLDAVFWAHPGQKLPPPVRMRLVRALYEVGHDSSEVQRLATQLALARHEPHEPIRRASLRFLHHLFHTLPSLPSQVLLTFLQAADPGEEPRESVRIQAYAFMSRAFPYWSSVRQQVYRILWLRLEPSFVCRLFLLERLLEWLPEQEATERERLEGLYLLQRALGDVNESAHLRFSLAHKLRDFRFGFLPPEVQNFIHLHLLPVCQQVLSELAPPRLPDAVTT